MPTSKQYWQERQELKYLSGEQKVNDYYAGLKKSFEMAKRDIQYVINGLTLRYSIANNMTYADSMKALNKKEIGELKDFIDRVAQNIGKYDLKLENMSVKARITRYEAMLMQVDALLQELYAVEYQHKGEELLKDVYSDSYYRSWYNIDQYHGFHQEFAQVSTQAIEELITYPFDGAGFSTRIWKQKDHMLQQLNESITSMLIQGRNPQTLAKDFAKKFETKEFEAYRLLHTEGSFIMEQSSQAAYKEDGVEKYEWLATLDIKTCERCRERDGKTYDVDKAVVGVNMPPLHSFDRCTTVPHYDDQNVTDRARMARDPVTGKGYEVPVDMTYKQWHKEFIEGNPQAVVSGKKWKNRKSDKYQYESYKNVLGKETPKSLDDFQNLKYTNSEGWEAKKREYGTISKIKNKESYSDEYRGKLLSTYYDFKKEGYEFTDHSLNRYLGQKTGKDKVSFKKDELLSVLGKDVNYLDGDGRTVKFYDGISVIQNNDTNEIISIVTRSKPKEGWKSKW
jgi:SPP1 gp7 family putative phage head morphogenesis protein